MISRAHPFLVLVALAMAASPVVVGILQLFRDRPEPEVVVTPQETTKDLERISNFFTVDRSRSVEVKPPPRFSFEFDSKTSLSELLPQPPKVASERPSPLNEDLARVPELAFGDPLARNLAKEKAMEKTAHVIAKINRVNEDKHDGFMIALAERRTDLRGLPFLMGEKCRTPEEQSRVFTGIADRVNRSLSSLRTPNATEIAQSLASQVQQARNDFAKINDRAFHQGAVAAVTQILMPESERVREGLAKYLATLPHVDATKALARLAIFSPEETVRFAAIEGLKLRRDKDYTDILLEGFRYPLPAVSKRAAEALVKLERKDVLVNLIDVLESPDPRLPVTLERDGKEVSVVNELVKVNHHRNCLLCHAPGNTANVPEGVLKVAVPLPGEPLPKPSDGGYQSTPPPSPDIVVRIDMTYLRQDFSVMMPVSDAHPWPDMQRFDFLVRTRELTAAEAKTYEPCCEKSEPGRLSPYHRSALYALRELTGRDTAPTAAAWRKLLKL